LFGRIIPVVDWLTPSCSCQKPTYCSITNGALKLQHVTRGQRSGIKPGSLGDSIRLYLLVKCCVALNIRLGRLPFCDSFVIAVELLF
jgi:hypothetical protein